MRFDPDGTPRTVPMVNPMRVSAQWQHCPMHKGCGTRQSAQARGNPRTVLFRKILRVPHAAARRNRQHDFTAYGVDTQRIAARLAMPAHANRMKLAVNVDGNRRRLAAAAVEQSSKGYGQHQFAGPRCVITRENTGSTLTDN